MSDPVNGPLSQRFVCASANPDKVAEIEAMLSGLVDLSPRPADLPDVVEDADTLIGNARLKASAVAAATGLPAISDDTGLFVDALDGRPGVFTARFAGEHATYAQNRALMLRLLEGVADRSARFVTVAMVVWPDGRELSVEGVCEGEITIEEHGDGGFGYQCIFRPRDGDGSTFAEMSSEAKHGISHRGRAFAALVAALSDSR